MAAKKSRVKKSRAKKSSAKKSAKGPSASRQAVGSVLSGHQADIWGVGAILVGLLAMALAYAGVLAFMGTF